MAIKRNGKTLSLDSEQASHPQFRIITIQNEIEK